MDRPRRLRLAMTCLIGLVLVIAGGAPAAAAAAAKKKPRTACQKLAASSKDRARSAQLVLVVRGAAAETGHISACVLPRGKVRTLASLTYRRSRDWAKVVATEGPWVLVEEVHNDQSGGRSRSLTRHDVRSGQRFTLSHYGCQRALDGPIRCPEGTDYGDIGLAASGSGAVERTDLATGLTTLWAFVSNEVFVKLADGAVDALRVTRSQVSWKQPGGVARTVPLPMG
jgi:hypothetical protein